jgi:hypothetical protein
MMATTRTIRRFALTVAVAGAAVLVTAPAASAAPSADVAQDGGAVVVDGNGNGGPDAFIVLEQGRKPVFFCDTENENMRHNNCETVGGETRF